MNAISDYGTARQRLGPVLAGVALALLGVIASVAVTLLSGTKTGAVLALVSIGGPVLGYAAIIAPLVFPFTMYVVLVPFDNVLNFSSFGTVTKLLAALSGAAIIFYMLRTRRIVRPHPALFLWVGVILWSATTAFWAIDTKSVFDLLPTALGLLVLYAAISILPTDRNVVQWVSLAAIAGGLAAAAYGTYLFRNGIEVSHGDRLWISNDTSYIDPNHFAAALLLPIALTIGITLYARKRIIMAAALVTLLIMLEGVAITGSRGALLGIAAMLAYFVIRSDRRIWLTVATVPTVVLALVLQPTLITRFATALSSGGSGRTDIWSVGWAAFKQHWLLGAGYNNFAFAYDDVYLQAHQVHYAYWHRAPHDLLVQSAVELGVIGLGLLLWAWWVQFRMLDIVPQSDSDYPIRLALEATMIGTFVAALFLDVMVMKYIWLTFTVIAIVRNAHLRRPQSDYA
jgi:O-antigen ligase